jgi:plasmid maintenance system killer protein
MIDIAPLDSDLREYLVRRNLSKKYSKQIEFLKRNRFHPGLHFELLEPHEMKIYSFRIDKRYRAICVYIEKDIIEIIEITNHYN